MDLSQASAVVTGGASGLGRATVQAFVDRGVRTVIVDLPSSDGAAVARELGELASFSPADVRDADAVDAAMTEAEKSAPLRAVVHCAGRGGKLRVVEKDGRPGDLDLYQEVIDINLVGSFNVLRLAAARMVRNEEVGGERGALRFGEVGRGRPRPTQRPTEHPQSPSSARRNRTLNLK